MLTIDRYAYNNRLRYVDPSHKAGLAFIVISLCLLLNRPAVGIVACFWMLGLISLFAGIPLQIAIGILSAETTFLLLASIGVAVSINTTVADDALWHLQIGPVWIATSSAMLHETARLVTRAIGAAAAMNFLALSTPMVDLIELLRRYRVAPYLVDIIMLMYRYVFVLLVTAQKMITAQSSRLGHGNLSRRFISSGLLFSRLFIEAYHRSQRMEIALQSRGYTNSLDVLPITYQKNRRLLFLSIPFIANLLLVWWLL